jgi:uncharacterized glyoxalase superfamily protein PhnB
MNERTMPECSVLPVIGYRNLLQTIDWLVRCFQFKERWRAGSHRAQLSYGNGTIAITELPESLQKINSHHYFSFIIRVENVVDHYEHAVQQGVQLLNTPTDMHYGEKQYSALDLDGNVWTFSQSIKDLSPEDWGGVSASNEANQ